MPSATSQPPTASRCRPIAEADLPAAVDLLVKGFADRTADYWRAGLARMAERPELPGCPRYGIVLENEGRLVGILLTLWDDGARHGGGLRCNLSSWYVEPEFRAQAPLLDRVAQRRSGVTYLNVSPAPHTIAIQEARGFTAFCSGQMFVVPALCRVKPGVRGRIAGAGDPLDDLAEADRRLVRDHLGYGCLCAVVDDGRGAQPLIFLRRRIGPARRAIGPGPVPCLQLVYCRDVATLPRLLGAVGTRLLVRSGIPWLVVDATAPLPGLVGRFFAGRAPKYARGPSPARLGDLAYTELVMFGA
ncbi:hypothetical protein D3273_03890 [Lichenibacterium minor]|jgi:hypothetical protein|uniref:Acyl-CoA acyltransferase n=1 Tax=Lichenibacterium minor TaxID=2316528 RepID=A0A4Q2U9W0_9HYPH|nr:hypothetical protein [Lichenibacterium minor]RYC33613.1 hypothetical protein D3273_03890 [Lichenibacterium minor]